MMTLLDREAVLKGMAIAIVVCLPLAIVSNIVRDDNDDSALLPLLFLAVAAGFALAGYVAARSSPAAPYTNGALAALAGFVVIQVVAVIVRVVDDESVGVGRIVGTALIAYAAGLVGAAVASRGSTPR